MNIFGTATIILITHIAEEAYYAKPVHSTATTLQNIKKGGKARKWKMVIKPNQSPPDLRTAI